MRAFLPYRACILAYACSSFKLFTCRTLAKNAENEIQANEAGEISCSFTFTQVGTWKITYLVFDAAYNITLQEVTVIVEA